MLHALPALLHDLEAKLIAGEDPLPLLGTVRWQELIGWPTDLEGAKALRQRVKNLQNLVGALEAPMRATLMKLGEGGTYAPGGGIPLPSTLSVRIHQHV